MFQRSFRIVASMLLLLTVVGCGGRIAAPEETIGDGAGAACLEGDVDCYETGAESPTEGFDLEAARQAAHGVVGMFETDLPEDVRVARRGQETFQMTSDHIPGRLTVELEDTDGSGLRVVLVTVELPDGQESYELTPG